MLERPPLIPPLLFRLPTSDYSRVLISLKTCLQPDPFGKGYLSGSMTIRAYYSFHRRRNRYIVTYTLHPEPFNFLIPEPFKLYYLFDSFCRVRGYFNEDKFCCRRGSCKCDYHPSFTQFLRHDYFLFP